MTAPYTPETLAERWQCSAETVRAMCRSGRLPSGPDLARLRSRSFAGMMAAAADQWGQYALDQERIKT